MTKPILSPKQPHTKISFPISISYPLDRPYAGATLRKVGDRVIITYFDIHELREALRLHRLAQQLEREITPGLKQKGIPL